MVYNGLQEMRVKGYTVSQLAKMAGVSVRTLQNWEQGHRTPQGPAVSLLRIIDNDPQAAIRALHKG